jgi:hypothetical protein
MWDPQQLTTLIGLHGLLRGKLYFTFTERTPVSSLPVLFNMVPALLCFGVVEHVQRDRLCALVVRVPGYRAEMYCVSCEVRPEFVYVM